MISRDSLPIVCYLVGSSTIHLPPTRFRSGTSGIHHPTPHHITSHVIISYVTLIGHTFRRAQRKIGRTTTTTSLYKNNHLELFEDNPTDQSNYTTYKMVSFDMHLDPLTGSLPFHQGTIRNPKAKAQLTQCHEKKSSRTEKRPNPTPPSLPMRSRFRLTPVPAVRCPSSTPSRVSSASR